MPKKKIVSKVGLSELVVRRPTMMVDSSEPDGEKVQVNPEAAEAFISEKRIGERIKYLRLKKSMGLVELGRHTGLSASFLIASGDRARGFLRCGIWLGFRWYSFVKDLSYFFDLEPPRRKVSNTSAEGPRAIAAEWGGGAYYIFESLGYLVPDRQLEFPYFAEFLPN